MHTLFFVHAGLKVGYCVNANGRLLLCLQHCFDCFFFRHKAYGFAHDAGLGHLGVVSLKPLQVAHGVFVERYGDGAHKIRVKSMNN